MSQILIRRPAGKSLQILRAGVVAAALVFSCLGGAEAQVTPQSVNVFQHFSDCLHALLSDSAEHKQFCTPGLALPGGSLSSGGGGKSVNCVPFQPIRMVAPPNLGFGEVLVVAEITAPPDLGFGERILVAQSCGDDDDDSNCCPR